jgi:hypothetical protein
MHTDNTFQSIAPHGSGTNVLGGIAMNPNDIMKRNRRGFLQVAGIAATAFTFAGPPSAARGASEATGKCRSGISV